MQNKVIKITEKVIFDKIGACCPYFTFFTYVIN